LPQAVLDIPRHGCINIHASLLPRWRGAAPIQRAILAGDKETGITIMQMDAGLDTGDMLLKIRTPINDDDTAASLHDRLALLGSDLLVKTLDAFAADQIHPVVQDHSRASYAPLLTKQDGQIDWKKPAAALDPFIRGMTPWPGAFTFHADRRLKVFSAKPVAKTFEEPPGTVLQSFPGELLIATGKDALSILEIQGPSGKRLLIEDFLRGYKLEPGTKLI